MIYILLNKIIGRLFNLNYEGQMLYSLSVFIFYLKKTIMFFCIFYSNDCSNYDVMLEMITQPNLRWSAFILPCDWHWFFHVGFSWSFASFSELFKIKIKIENQSEKSKRVRQYNPCHTLFSAFGTHDMCVSACVSVQKLCHFDSPKLGLFSYGIFTLLAVLVLF